MSALPTTRSSQRATVTAIIPCLDEEMAVGPCVAAVLAHGIGEVIVVDGGSTDQTVARASAAGARVVIERRRGYGRALLSGLAAVAPHATIILFIDGDGSDRPDMIPAVLEPIERGSADFVLGSRLRGSREPGSLHSNPNFVRPPCRPADPAALWCALHRHVAVSCHPLRRAQAPWHVRGHLRLEPGDADACCSRKAADRGSAGGTAPARRWRFQGLRQLEDGGASGLGPGRDVPAPRRPNPDPKGRARSQTGLNGVPAAAAR